MAPRYTQIKVATRTLILRIAQTPVVWAGGQLREASRVLTKNVMNCMPLKHARDLYHTRFQRAVDPNIRALLHASLGDIQ